MRYSLALSVLTVSSLGTSCSVSDPSQPQTPRQLNFDIQPRTVSRSQVTSKTYSVSDLRLLVTNFGSESVKYEYGCPSMAVAVVTQDKQLTPTRTVGCALPLYSKTIRPGETLSIEVGTFNDLRKLPIGDYYWALGVAPYQGTLDKATLYPFTLAP